MKVGTDGVLLGAWVDVASMSKRSLDIGTGTGVIALMLAQRVADAQILGVDIESVEEAATNAASSPWADRLRFEQTAVQQLDAPHFDLIVSNPPFFVESLRCPDRGRTMARHAVALPFDELCDAVVRLLAPDGRFALVLPTSEAERFVACCEGKLALCRLTEVRTTPRHAPKRSLMELVHVAQAPARVQRDALTIGTGEHETYTEEYRLLTRDFYLKF